MQKKKKKSARNRPEEGEPFTMWKLKQEDRGIPYLTSSGNVCIKQLKSRTAPRMYMNDRKSTVEYWFWSYKYTLARKWIHKYEAHK